MKKLECIAAKIRTRSDLTKDLARWRMFDKKIVFTNGCFDLLHRGHVEYLAKAAEMGNVLIVGVNSDSSVKLLNKGKNRPIQDEASRALIIASLHLVDAVIVFDEHTPYEWIKFIQPDVLVKGNDYKVEEIAGHDLVLAKGGRVELVELTKGFSTSAIEQKIKQTGD